MTLTSTGVSRDNDSSVSGSSKTLKKRNERLSHSGETNVAPKYFQLVLTNQLAARRGINQREGEGKMRNVLPFISSIHFPGTRSYFLH